ncbi:synaptobrevin isoform X1 [Anastrepha obliqua]|uniref:synaptobrevin isoform X1 n=1 Tax=Anastrepha ludens TaxID=28586 RepID=UPI0023AE6E07|nr:synaptobrevin isoform X1 [Anastrepha ludens]XP_054739001.1 synaptobrevin isoform X1 [Anastrepha obliqua]XP_054739002.1 synaptobrevin isoform X1 [Anastrepha obliqua]
METPNDIAAPSGSTDFPVLPPPPNSATPSNNNQAQKRLQQTQAKVDEVVGIMRVNVEKVLERDQKLSELGERADALEAGASQFEQQAGKLKRKQWWANMKMMIIMGVIGVVLLIIIIVSFLPSSGSSSNTNNEIQNTSSKP